MEMIKTLEMVLEEVEFVLHGDNFLWSDESVFSTADEHTRSCKSSVRKSFAWDSKSD